MGDGSYPWQRLFTAEPSWLEPLLCLLLSQSCSEGRSEAGDTHAD